MAPDKRPTFLETFAFRLFALLILVAILSVAATLFPDLYHARGNRIEISGLSPGEMVVIEKLPLAAYRFRASVGLNGIVEFHNLPLGEWRITDGGTEELKAVVIPLRELMGRFTGQGDELRILPAGNGWRCVESVERGWPAVRISWGECGAFVKQAGSVKIRIEL